MDTSAFFKDAQFHRSVWYTFNPASGFYTFYVAGDYRSLHPVAMFTPMVKEGIPFDPEEMCEIIADYISQANPDDSYDIET